jgi:putative ABC transport system permease protein
MPFARRQAMLQDLRRAVRALRHAPSFALTAVLTLAIGIAATTAIVTVLNGVLLSPLPYAEPDRLVVLLHGGVNPVSPADYRDYRQQARSFASLSAAQAWSATLTGAGVPERLQGLQVSPDLFSTLGVQPAFGRTFAAGEDEPGRDRVVVIGHGLWVDRFGRDPRVIGQSIVLDGERHTIVGIMPQRFHFAPFWITTAALWRPLTLTQRMADRGGRSLRLFARLGPDTTLEEAQADVSAIAARLAAAYPATNARLGVEVVPLHEKVVGAVRPTLLLLGATAALVLLVACVNVASLQLVRGSARQRELAVRAAFGAGRGRLVRELLAESLLLSAAGGALGVLLAAWAVSGIGSLLPPGSMPRQAEIDLDPTVLAVAAGAAAISALLAGLAPALQLSRASVHDALRDGARGATEGAGGRRLRRLLQAAELALAMALLAGAGLMGRTLLALHAVDPGFDPEGVLSVTVSLGGTPHAAVERRVAFFDSLSAVLERLPGVSSIGAINHLPLGGDTWRLGFLIEGRAAPRPGEEPRATWRLVRPGYFETMRLPLREGRAFDHRDREGGMPVAIVNETMAARHWPGASALGSRVRIGVNDHDPPLTIVGVVKNARQDEWTGAVREEIYVPHAQHAGDFGSSELTFVVRAAGEPAAMSAAVQRAIRALDDTVPVTQAVPMRQVIADRLWRSRVTAAILGVFGLVAVALAALGVYGVSAYVMTRRTREIGIRMALGARPCHVRRLAFADTLTPVLAGIVAGSAGALAVGRFIEGLLYDVQSNDPASFGGAVLTLSVTALVAAWIPARRASHLDPNMVLREE